MIGAIVLAAGSGKRMRSSINKPYLDLAGRPVLAYSLKTIASMPQVAGIVIALRAGDEADAAKAVRAAGVADRVVAVINGGAERQDSVRSALAACPGVWDHILVHDGARPLLSNSLLQRLIAAAGEKRGVVPGLTLKDSIKTVDTAGQVIGHPDRNAFMLVQTPQLFPREALMAAHQKSADEGFFGTDDAAVFAYAGGNIQVIPGEARNIKITVSEDLALAQFYLKEDAYADGHRL